MRAFLFIRRMNIMNLYDNEENIIKSIQLVERRDINFVNPTLESIKFFYSIYKEKKFKKWIKSFGKDVPPPDFYSDKYRYMLEVMRVDDFVAGNQSPNALESKRLKEIDDMFRENGLPPHRELNIHIMINPNRTNVSENGYDIYIENFKRIVNKHSKKIKNYRNNHPGYKLGFLIFDESPGYFCVENRNIMVRCGEKIHGFPHFYFKDKKFVESFMDEDLDFVIWVTPYKNLPQNPRIYPEISIFDLKRKQIWKKHIVGYDSANMVCLEAKE